MVARFAARRGHEAFCAAVGAPSAPAGSISSAKAAHGFALPAKVDVVFTPSSTSVRSMAMRVFRIGRAGAPATGC